MLLQKRIHDWSKTLPDWQRDLLRRLAGGTLTDDERDEVLAILTEQKGAADPVPLQLDDLPADEDEHGPVELTAVSDLENINLLAGGQSLQFTPGLNVVFGLTGAGKSGYGRLLRRVCRAAHRGEVLRDAFDPGTATAPQTARLGITVDGDGRDVNLDLAQDPERLLSSMAVFDAHCASVFISGSNTIDHVPRPMRLLRSLVEAQDALAAQLGERANELRDKLAPLPEIDTDTEVGRQLAALTATTDLAQVEQFAPLTEDELAEMKKLDIATATIKSDQSRQIEAAARLRARTAKNAADALHGAGQLLTDDTVKDIREARSGLDEATAAERELVDKAFSGQRFPQTGQGPWQEMWEAARRFVEAGGGTFPDTGPDASCPTCQQALDGDARQRMTTFEEFVRGDLSQRIARLRADLAAKTQAIPDIGATRTRVDDALDGSSQKVTKTAKETLDLLAERERFARAVAGGKEESTQPPPLVDISIISDYGAEQSATADTQAALRDEAEQRRVISRLAELQARKALLGALPVVQKHIETLQVIAGIEVAKCKLGTKRISDQLRELQQAVITDRLRKAVETELEGLDPVAGRIEVVGQAAKGETVIRLRLKEPCRESVGDVLSDGEQRALALAFFLADVAVSKGRSAIILDDPISSLDHERRTYVARRLVEEAERRQVIVFTHDFTFVYLLQEAAEQAGHKLAGQTLQRANHQIGVVSNELPTKTMSPSRRRKDLRRRLNNVVEPLHTRQEPMYEREADIWTTDLRKAFDQLIEDYVLAGTVRRWHSQVRVRQLRHVKWSMDIVERIEAGMKKAANKTHHEAAELQPAPFTPTELSAMLDEYEALCELTHPEKAAADAKDGDATNGSAAAEGRASLRGAS